MPWDEQLDAIRRYAQAIRRDVRLMEVCGTHTVAAFRSGLRTLLPADVSLLSGPGCPVCVTPSGYIDRAVEIARTPDTVLATFGDMLRVPGNRLSLERGKALGGSVKIVYSPSDALEFAVRHADIEVVFAGVGFETTAPGVAWTIAEAKRRRVTNFSVLAAHKLMPPAMAALVAGGHVEVDGFLCPGHVSAVIGADAYRFLADEHGIPCVVAGFEPGDLLVAVAMLLRQIAEGRHEVEVQYTRAVSPGPNVPAMRLLAKVFTPSDATWRGLGIIAGSGLQIRPDFSEFDAEKRFGAWSREDTSSDRGCICGDILRGSHTPDQCPLFGRACTPSTPVGACMVSREGACAAYFRYAARPSHRSGQEADISC